jgi:hypothetical protein
LLFITLVGEEKVPLSDEMQIQQFLVTFQEFAQSDPSDRALKAEVEKLDSRLYAGLVSTILSTKPTDPSNERRWRFHWIYQSRFLLDTLCENGIPYTRDDIKAILNNLHDQLLKEYRVQGYEYEYYYKRYLSNLFVILDHVLGFLKQEQLIEVYRPELERLYQHVSIWGNYEPYDTSYRIRWEMDRLLFGENTSNLAARVQRYGREEQVSLEAQGEELLRVYHKELGASFVLTPDHPCVQLLSSQIIPPLRVAFVRALLRSEVRLAQDWPLFKAFLTMKEAYTPAAIHEILHGLQTNYELYGNEFLERCDIRVPLLQRFFHIEREHDGVDRSQMEEDVRTLLRLLNKMALQNRKDAVDAIGEAKVFTGSAFLATLDDLLLYVKQEGLVAMYRPELKELYSTTTVWDNYMPDEKAYRLHQELNGLLFGEHAHHLASLVQRLARETERPLAEQVTGLLHTFYKEVQNLSFVFDDHPTVALLGQAASPVQIALIKALLRDEQCSERKVNSTLFKALLTEKQDYAPDDIQEILQMLNAHLASQGMIFLDFCHLSPSLVETFGRILGCVRTENEDPKQRSCVP